VRVLNSWNEVIEIIEDEEMIDFVNEQTNLISDDVSKNMEVYRKWNEYFEYMNPEVSELVESKISPGASNLRWYENLFHNLRGKIVLAGIEIYYRAYTRRDFHQSMIRWLLKGHIPVGWELGNYPEGRPIVY
jgi:hypothetical protein